MKKTKYCVTRCVLAGDKTHWQVDGTMLCGSKDKVTGEYRPKRKVSDGNMEWLLPVCRVCVEANTDRWGAVK